MNTKKCCKCKVVKDLNEFSKDKYRKDGYRSNCRQCCVINSQKYRKLHPEIFKLQRRRYYDKKKKENPYYQRKYQLKSYYNLELDNYENMIKEQNGICAICNQRTDKLCVDHNHSTGKVRQLLCTRCNHGLGNFRENINFLENAIIYIRKHQ